MNKYYAGVGSRDTPDESLRVMVRLGTVLCNLGWGLSSGDAIGADQAFWSGALLSPKFNSVKNRIYLSWDGVGGRYHDEEIGHYNAQLFDTYETAKQMAFEARGSFEGLGRGGISHHTRNVFQIYGHTLNEIVGGLIYWSIPVDRKEKCKGGTNTALQLAIKAGVPHRINLYTDEGMQRAMDFLEIHENNN